MGDVTSVGTETPTPKYNAVFVASQSLLILATLDSSSQLAPSVPFGVWREGILATPV